MDGCTNNVVAAPTKTGTGSQVCVVCEEAASGVYFGALVCLPCKSFYIRSTKDGTPNFICTSSGSCDITKANRQKCQYCRYEKCLSVGMARKEKPEVIVPCDNQALCAVCGDVANGVHFGKPTCEGCKKFFRRALKEFEEYKCNKNGDCIVNPRTRNDCRFCRYMKAVSQGMSRQAIKMGRPRKKASSAESSNKSSATLPGSSTAQDTPVTKVTQDANHDAGGVTMHSSSHYTGQHQFQHLRQWKQPVIAGNSQLKDPSRISSDHQVSLHRSQLQPKNSKKEDCLTENRTAMNSDHYSEHPDLEARLLNSFGNSLPQFESGVGSERNIQQSLGPHSTLFDALEKISNPLEISGLDYTKKQPLDLSQLSSRGVEKLEHLHTGQQGNAHDQSAAIHDLVSEKLKLAHDAAYKKVENVNHCNIPSDKPVNESAGSVPFQNNATGNGIKIKSEHSNEPANMQLYSQSRSSDAVHPGTSASAHANSPGHWKAPSEKSLPPQHHHQSHGPQQSQIFKFISQYTNSEWARIEENGQLFFEPRTDLLAEFIEYMDKANFQHHHCMNQKRESHPNSAKRKKSLTSNGKEQDGLNNEKPLNVYGSASCVESHNRDSYCLFDEFDSSHWDNLNIIEYQPMSQLHEKIIDKLIQHYEVLLEDTDEKKNPNFRDVIPLTKKEWPENKQDTIPFWKHIRDRIVRNTHSVVNFMKKLPGSSRLSWKDQIHLCRNGAFNVTYALTAADRFLPKERNFKYFWNWEVPPHNPVYRFRKELLDIGESIYNLNMDQAEKALCVALLFISPDWTGLEDEGNVANIHNVYLAVLKSYMCQRQRTDEWKHNLVYLMLKTREMTMWHAKMLDRMTFQFRDQELSSIFRQEQAAKVQET